MKVLTQLFLSITAGLAAIFFALLEYEDYTDRQQYEEWKRKAGGQHVWMQSPPLHTIVANTDCAIASSVVSVLSKSGPGRFIIKSYYHLDDY